MQLKLDSSLTLKLLLLPQHNVLFIGRLVDFVFKSIPYVYIIKNSSDGSRYLGNYHLT